MKEDFLHQIWKQQLFLKTNPLITGHGEMAVIKTGFKNRHAGPDFEQARIRLADIEWNGSVEIHVRASEWNEHGHQQDAAYQSVILHVVWEKDTDVFRKDGTVVPCLEIKNLVPLEVLFRYRELTEAGKDEMIPCAALLHGTEPFLMVQMQERVLVERLEKKAEAIRRRYLQSGKDWLTTLYHTLAWGIGLKINAEGMEMLAASVPLKTAASTGWDAKILAAVYLGQAGLLDARKPVQKELHSEYLHQAAKFGLQPPPVQWKRFRLRPGAFPEQRILLLAKLVSVLPILIEYPDLNVPPSAWLKVFQSPDNPEIFGAFLKEKEWTESHIGLTPFIENNLIINVLSPFLTAIGLEKKENEKIEKALEGLSELPPEDNRLIKIWASIGVRAQSAAESQSLLELQQGYCANKRCMECLIGARILKKTPE
jgi:hypothetical protein